MKARKRAKTIAAVELERAAYLARAAMSLTVDMGRDPEEFACAMSLLSEILATIHDTLDHQIRRSGDPGIGFLDPLRALLDERAKTAP